MTGAKHLNATGIKYGGIEKEFDIETIGLEYGWIEMRHHGKEILNNTQTIYTIKKATFCCMEIKFDLLHVIGIIYKCMQIKLCQNVMNIKISKLLFNIVCMNYYSLSNIIYHLGQ